MPLVKPDQQNVDDFFEAIESIREGYAEPSFSYLATRHGTAFTLVQGRVLFNTAPSKIPFELLPV